MTLTASDLANVIEAVQEDFVGEGKLTERQQRRLAFMLGDLDGTPVTYGEVMYALRDLMAGGLKYRPKPGEILEAVASRRANEGIEREDTRARDKFQRTYRAACVIYGKQLATEFLDPHGLHADWCSTPTPAHDAEQWAGARKKLIALGALNRPSNTTAPMAQGATPHGS